MLEVEQDSAAVERGLDNLIKKLTTLRSIVSNGRGYGTTAKGIKEIGEAANTLNATSASNLRLVIDAMQGLQNLSNIKLSSSIAAQIRGIGESARSLQGIDWSGVRAIEKNIAPLENIKKAAGLASTVAAMKKLPEVVEKLNTNLDDAKVARFAERVNALRNTLVPLADEMRAITNGFSVLPRNIQKAINATNKFSESSRNAYNSSNGLLRRLTSIAAAYLSIRTVWRFAMDSFGESNDFVESINLANVAMGDGAKSAMEFAKRVEELIGINMSDWITQVGTFNQMIAGFGISQKQSAHMAQQLTQLGYDIQSAFNAKDIGQVMDRLQSGLAGQIKGMREYGVELSVSAMKEFALERGITKRWTAMSMAEKTALRYAKIMADTVNIQQDLSRTLITPSNSLRVLNSQWKVAQRYIGQFVSVIAAKAIPILQSAVAVVSALAQALANAWGYVLPDIPTTGVVGGLDDVEDAIDNITGAAGGASKKIKGLLASWDEINVIQSESGGGGGGSSIVQDAFDFTGLTDYSYDFLDGIKEKTQDITKTVQNLFPLLKTIAIAFGAWQVSKSVTDFIVGAKALFDTIKGAGLALKIPLAITGIVLGFSLVLDAAESAFANNKVGIKELVEGALGVGAVALTTGLAAGSAAIGITIAGGVALTAILTAFYLKREKEYSELAAAAFSDSAKDGVSPSDMIAAVEAEFSARAGSAKLVIDAYADVGTYNEALKTATEQISALNNVIFGDEALTATQATAFKEAWGIVTDTLNSIQSASYDTVFAGLVEAAKSTNAELAKQATEAQKNLIMIQTGYTEWQADLKVEMNELTDKIVNGQATDADMKRYATLSEALSASVEDQKKKLNFDEAVANAANVNYESIDDVKAYVSELEKAYADYVSINENALKAYTDSVENLRAVSMIRLQTGDITQAEYNVISAQLDEMVSVYSKEIGSRNKELQGTVSRLLVGIWEQALKNPKITDFDAGVASQYVSDNLQPILEAVESSKLLDETTVEKLRTYLSELQDSLSSFDDFELRGAGYGGGVWALISKLIDFSEAEEYPVEWFQTIRKQLDEISEWDFGTETVEKPFGAWKTLKENLLPSMQKAISDMKAQYKPLSDDIIIKVKTDTSNLQPALDEIEKYADEVEQAINDAFTFEFDFTVDIGPFGGVVVTGAPKIPQYAQGGVPQTGSLFIANESGPELVGKFGGGSGVANSDQIVAGITAGVSQANASQNALLREQNTLLRQLLDKEFTAKVAPSVGFGQAAQRSLDMYNRVTGVSR